MLSGELKGSIGSIMMTFLTSFMNTISGWYDISKKVWRYCRWWILHGSETIQVPKKVPFHSKMLSQEKQNLLQNAIMSPRVPSLRDCDRAGIQYKCLVVEVWEPISEHVKFTLCLHLTKFNGVGRVSKPTQSRKDSCPDGSPCKILLYQERRKF